MAESNSLFSRFWAQAGKQIVFRPRAAQRVGRGASTNRSWPKNNLAAHLLRESTVTKVLGILVSGSNSNWVRWQLSASSFTCCQALTSTAVVMVSSGTPTKLELLAADIGPPVAKAGHLLHKAARDAGVIQLGRRKGGRPRSSAGVAGQVEAAGGKGADRNVVGVAVAAFRVVRDHHQRLQLRIRRATARAASSNGTWSTSPSW